MSHVNNETDEFNDGTDEYPEQFSERARTALHAADEDPVEARHAEHAGALRGGSSELADLFDANVQVESLLHAWNEPVGDHTGTWLVVFLGRDDEDPTENLENEGDIAIGDGESISVVSRWDLRVGEPAGARLYGESGLEQRQAIDDLVAHNWAADMFRDHAAGRSACRHGSSELASRP